MGLWLVMAMIAGLMLMGVRQYGHGVIARQTARQLLGDARNAVDRGAWYDAQRALRETLRVWPPFADRILSDFGRFLTSLPMVKEEIRQMESDGAIRLTETSSIALIAGETCVSKEMALVRPDTVTGEASLWLGRTAMEYGDVTVADAFFKNYWNENRRRRAEVRDKLAGDLAQRPQDYYAAGKRLLFNGLWTEAFAAFERARATGYQNADMICWNGVEAELHGRTDEAKQAYREVLMQLPSHRLALVRTQLIAKK
jgi:tetratricopeptide (TPR) repeat protein